MLRVYEQCIGKYIGDEELGQSMPIEETKQSEVKEVKLEDVEKISIQLSNGEICIFIWMS